MTTQPAPKKSMISIRIDDAVVEYFKRIAATNEGSYQRMINTVLRTHVEQQVKKEKK